MDDASHKSAPAGANAAKERFARLYDSEMPRVYRYVSYLVGSREEAEELTTDIFSRALRLWPQVAEGPGSSRAWLFTLASNRLADHFRQGRDRPAAPLEQRFDLQCGLPTPGAGGVSRDGVAGLLARLAGLPERDRNVLALRFGGGLDRREMAEVLGVGEAAAAGALLQAVRRLYERYQGEGR